MAAPKDNPRDRQAPAQPADAGAAKKQPAPQKGVVDEASDESFPASDPPSFTPTRAGTPDDTEEE